MKKKKIPANPFILTGYVSPDYFCDREQEKASEPEQPLGEDLWEDDPEESELQARRKVDEENRRIVQQIIDEIEY